MNNSSYILAFCLTSVGFLASCAEQVDPFGSESVEAAKQAITSNCTLQTVGLPCDPDGNGRATECEGVCWIDANRAAQCVSVNRMGMEVTELNGRLCGDATGQDCARSCENGVCVDKNARLGTACRPDNQSSTCDGLCTLIGGKPACDAYSACSDTGITGCTMRACGFSDNTTGCQNYSLPGGTTCDDGLSCTSGETCNDSGACVPRVNSCGTGTGGGSSNGTGGGGANGTGTGTSAGTGGAATSNVGGNGVASPNDSDSTEPSEITGGAGCSISGRVTSVGLGLLPLVGLALLRRRRARR